MDVHAGLHEQFAVHRDYVVGLDFPRALQELERFERELRVHMEAEEKVILPLYEQRVGHVLGGDPQFFTLEHQNLLRNLERAKEGLRQLISRADSGRRQAHEFLQEESLFLQLLAHHDLREKNVLYPRLSEALSPEEVEEVLSKCLNPSRP
jgi:hemerythrin-like domain-containing protein